MFFKADKTLRNDFLNISTLLMLEYIHSLTQNKGHTMRKLSNFCKETIGHRNGKVNFKINRQENTGRA